MQHSDEEIKKKHHLDVLTTENVDLYKYPNQIIKDENPDAAIVIGDLHGNPIKLLNYLIRYGILEITPSADKEKIYQAIIEAYVGDDVKKHALEVVTSPIQLANKLDFNRLIANHIKVIGKTNVVFLGDMLAERGLCDYFTLKLLSVLNSKRVSILFSNHDTWFIDVIENPEHSFLRFMARDPEYIGQNLSLSRLYNTNLAGIISRKEIKELYDQFYKPMAKALSYTLRADNRAISVYTHSGFGLEGIAAMARKLNIVPPFNDDTAAALAATIDRINAAYQVYVREDRVHTLYNPQVMFNSGGKWIDPTIYPFEALAWNRAYDKLQRPAQHKGYALNFGHGHDSNENTSGNIFNLDNRHGYTWRPQDNIGRCQVMRVHGKSDMTPQMEPAPASPSMFQKPGKRPLEPVTEAKKRKTK